MHINIHEHVALLNKVFEIYKKKLQSERHSILVFSVDDRLAHHFFFSFPLRCRRSSGMESGILPSTKPNGVKSRTRRQQPAGTLGMRSLTQPSSEVPPSYGDEVRRSLHEPTVRRPISLQAVSSLKLIPLGCSRQTSISATHHRLPTKRRLTRGRFSEGGREEGRGGG